MADMFSLARLYAERYPAAVARILEDEVPGETSRFIAALDPGASGEVLANLAPDRAARSLDGLSDEQAADRLGRMAPRHTASILRELSERRRRALLERIPQARRLQTNFLLRQPRRTVGAWMETQIPSAPMDAIVEAALNRMAEQAAQSSGIYVLGPERSLVGWVPVAKLLGADRAAHLESLMERDVPRLRANAGIDAALVDPAWEESDALAVIDSDGRLVGAIRYLDLRRARLQAAVAEPVEPGLGTLMDTMNHLYIGMAEVMDVSIARRAGNAPSRSKRSDR